MSERDEAIALYAELLDHKADVGQAFLNGFRRCLMVFDPAFRPGDAGDFQSEPVSTGADR